MMDYRFKNSTLFNSNAKPNNNSMSNNRQVLYINSFNKLDLLVPLLMSLPCEVRVNMGHHTFL